MKKQRRRVEWHPAVEWLRIPLFIAVFLALLPVMLPVALVQHGLTERRKRAEARRTACRRCGAILGEAALARADAEWSQHFERLRREHPGRKFRLVRRIRAECAACGQRYGYDEKARVFVEQREPDAGQ